MEKYYGNYLGITINNDDPEKRGRVQVFVPHIMPALYDGWNKEGKDVNLTCVGDNLPNALSSEQIEKLRKILPWAEAASPIIGSSSPGNLVTQAVNKVAGAVSGAINAASHYLFDQSPVAQPASAAPQDQTALFNAASKYGGVSPEEFASNSSTTGKCGVGSRSILGAMTGNSYFAQGLGIGGNDTAASLAGGDNNYLTNSGFFNNGGQPANLNAFNDPSKIPVGTTVAATGGHRGQGHVQVWTGSAWVSNFSQSADGGHAIPGTNGILASSGGVPYDNFTVYYPTTPIGGGTASPQQSTTVADSTSVAGETAVANVHATPDPTAANAGSDTLDGSVADPTVQNNATAGGNTSLNASALPPGLQPYAQDFIAAGQKYNVDPNFLAAISWNETGGGTSKAFREGNNAMGISNSKGPIYGFTSVAESIDRQAKTLSNPNGPYAGASTIGQIGNIYSPVGAENDFYGTNSSWIPTVGSFYNKLTGKDPNSPVLPGDGKTPPPAPGASPTSLVHNTSPYGAVATQPLNNTAKGVFTYPAAGSMLWVFFREGNPLYPVYFAASYSADEWKSATRHGSNGPMMTPGATEDGVTSTGGIMNLNGVGGLRWEDTNHPTDPTKSQKSMMFFGQDGSNMFMGNGYHQIFSKFDRRDQVEGDRWNTTLGHKEDWVQGDHNHVTMGNVYVKIGNVSQPAVDAVTRIQQLIKDGHKPLTDLK